MTSNEMRNNPLFLRNGFESAGRWGIPVIKKQDIPLDNVGLIAFSDTRSKASSKDKSKGVHFCIDDYRFNSVYNIPYRSLNKLSQYAFLCTPDFSTYQEMEYWRQMESVAHSRWVGAFWQSNGLLVVPTITWSDAGSYDFCFGSVETGSTVLVGMPGCKQDKMSFLRGYYVMMERIKPSAVICFGDPYEEMINDNLIHVDYRSSKKAVR